MRISVRLSKGGPLFTLKCNQVNLDENLDAKIRQALIDYGKLQEQQETEVEKKNPTTPAKMIQDIEVVNSDSLTDDVDDDSVSGFKPGRNEDSELLLFISDALDKAGLGDRVNVYLAVEETPGQMSFQETPLKTAASNVRRLSPGVTHHRALDRTPPRPGQQTPDVVTPPLPSRLAPSPKQPATTPMSSNSGPAAAAATAVAARPTLKYSDDNYLNHNKVELVDDLKNYLSFYNDNDERTRIGHAVVSLGLGQRKLSVLSVVKAVYRLLLAIQKADDTLNNYRGDRTELENKLNKFLTECRDKKPKDQAELFEDFNNAVHEQIRQAEEKEREQQRLAVERQKLEEKQRKNQEAREAAKERERAEQRRQARENEAKRERAEQRRQARENEAKRERAEQQRLAAEQKQREEQERQAREAAERKQREQQRLAAEQKQREEQERQAREAAERKQREQQRLAAEQKQREEQERQAREAAERKQREQQRLAAEQKQREEQERQAREAAERKQREQQRLAAEQKQREEERQAREAAEQEQREQQRLAEEQKRREERERQAREAAEQKQQQSQVTGSKYKEIPRGGASEPQQRQSQSQRPAAVAASPRRQQQPQPGAALKARPYTKMPSMEPNLAMMKQGQLLEHARTLLQKIHNLGDETAAKQLFNQLNDAQKPQYLNFDSSPELRIRHLIGQTIRPKLKELQGAQQAQSSQQPPHAQERQPSVTPPAAEAAVAKPEEGQVLIDLSDEQSQPTRQQAAERQKQAQELQKEQQRLEQAQQQREAQQRREIVKSAQEMADRHGALLVQTGDTFNNRWILDFLQKELAKCPDLDEQLKYLDGMEGNLQARLKLSTERQRLYQYIQREINSLADNASQRKFRNQLQQLWVPGEGTPLATSIERQNFELSQLVTTVRQAVGAEQQAQQELRRRAAEQQEQKRRAGQVARQKAELEQQRRAAEQQARAREAAAASASTTRHATLTPEQAAALRAETARASEQPTPRRNVPAPSASTSALRVASKLRSEMRYQSQSMQELSFHDFYRRMVRFVEERRNAGETKAMELIANPFLLKLYKNPNANPEDHIEVLRGSCGAYIQSTRLEPNVKSNFLDLLGQKEDVYELSVFALRLPQLVEGNDEGHSLARVAAAYHAVTTAFEKIEDSKVGHLKNECYDFLTWMLNKATYICAMGEKHSSDATITLTIQRKGKPTEEQVKIPAASARSLWEAGAIMVEIIEEYIIPKYADGKYKNALRLLEALEKVIQTKPKKQFLSGSLYEALHHNSDVTDSQTADIAKQLGIQQSAAEGKTKELLRKAWLGDAGDTQTKTASMLMKREYTVQTYTNDALAATARHLQPREGGWTDQAINRLCHLKKEIDHAWTDGTFFAKLTQQPKDDCIPVTSVANLLGQIQRLSEKLTSQQKQKLPSINSDKDFKLQRLVVRQVCDKVLKTDDGSLSPTLEMRVAYLVIRHLFDSPFFKGKNTQQQRKLLATLIYALSTNWGTLATFLDAQCQTLGGYSDRFRFSSMYVEANSNPAASLAALEKDNDRLAVLMHCYKRMKLIGQRELLQKEVDKPVTDKHMDELSTWAHDVEQLAQQSPEYVHDTSELGRLEERTATHAQTTVLGDIYRQCAFFQKLEQIPAASLKPTTLNSLVEAEGFTKHWQFLEEELVRRSGCEELNITDTEAVVLQKNLTLVKALRAYIAEAGADLTKLRNVQRRVQAAIDLATPGILGEMTPGLDKQLLHLFVGKGNKWYQYNALNEFVEAAVWLDEYRVAFASLKELYEHSQEDEEDQTLQFIHYQALEQLMVKLVRADSSIVSHVIEPWSAIDRADKVIQLCGLTKAGLEKPAYMDDEEGKKVRKPHQSEAWNFVKTLPVIESTSESSQSEYFVEQFRSPQGKLSPMKLAEQLVDLRKRALQQLETTSLAEYEKERLLVGIRAGFVLNTNSNQSRVSPIAGIKSYAEWVKGLATNERVLAKAQLLISMADSINKHALLSDEQKREHLLKLWKMVVDPRSALGSALAVSYHRPVQLDESREKERAQQVGAGTYQQPVLNYGRMAQIYADLLYARKKVGSLLKQSDPEKHPNFWNKKRDSTWPQGTPDSRVDAEEKRRDPLLYEDPSKRYQRLAGYLDKCIAEFNDANESSALVKILEVYEQIFAEDADHNQLTKEVVNQPLYRASIWLNVVNLQTQLADALMPMLDALRDLRNRGREVHSYRKTLGRCLARIKSATSSDDLVVALNDLTKEDGDYQTLWMFISAEYEQLRRHKDTKYKRMNMNILEPKAFQAQYADVTRQPLRHLCQVSGAQQAPRSLDEYAKHIVIRRHKGKELDRPQQQPATTPKQQPATTPTPRGQNGFTTFREANQWRTVCELRDDVIRYLGEYRGKHFSDKNIKDAINVILADIRTDYSDSNSKSKTLQNFCDCIYDNIFGNAGLCADQDFYTGLVMQFLSKYSLDATGQYQGLLKNEFLQDCLNKAADSVAQIMRK